MTLLRRPAPRFVVWVAVLVGVAAGAGVAGLSPWAIAAVEFAAWVIVAVCERTLAGAWPVGARAATPAVSRPVATPSEPIARATTPVEPPVVEPERDVEPPRTAVPAAPAPGRWNIWLLEQLAQQQSPADEELVFLVHYLREFADARGLLPTGFDALVRESFGELLPRAG